MFHICFNGKGALLLFENVSMLINVLYRMGLNLRWPTPCNIITTTVWLHVISVLYCFEMRKLFTPFLCNRLIP